MYTAEFLKNLKETYADETTDAISKHELLLQLASRDTHAVIVSHVKTPCNIQIQLSANVDSLNKLMDELETAYHGIGSTLYTMPDEYMSNGRLCAGIFPSDNNWHLNRPGPNGG